jgi:XTP/dITP diphosphohydrolase
MERLKTKLTLAAATGNLHKIEEITAVLAPLGVCVLSAEAAGVPDFDPEETEDTFEGNSLLKAKALLDMTGLPSIADDSGLEVDALGGAPGVLSARFAGESDHGGEVSGMHNNQLLLRLLADVPDEARAARFVCVITALWPDGRKIVARGECPGHIARGASGSGGFGYDPLFVPDEYAEEGLSFADIPAEQKNRISHRARALAAFSEELRRMTGLE